MAMTISREIVRERRKRLFRIRPGTAPVYRIKRVNTGYILTEYISGGEGKRKEGQNWLLTVSSVRTRRKEKRVLEKETFQRNKTKLFILFVLVCFFRSVQCFYLTNLWLWFLEGIMLLGLPVTNWFLEYKRLALVEHHETCLSLSFARVLFEFARDGTVLPCNAIFKRCLARYKSKLFQICVYIWLTIFRLKCL